MTGAVMSGLHDTLFYKERGKPECGLSTLVFEGCDPLLMDPLLTSA
jgi:hypothetical protein